MVPRSCSSRVGKEEELHPPPAAPHQRNLMDHFFIFIPHGLAHTHTHTVMILAPGCIKKSRGRSQRGDLASSWNKINYCNHPFVHGFYVARTHPRWNGMDLPPFFMPKRARTHGGRKFAGTNFSINNADNGPDKEMSND